MSVDDSSSIISLVALSGEWTAVIDGAKLETESELMSCDSAMAAIPQWTIFRQDGPNHLGFRNG